MLSGTTLLSVICILTLLLWWLMKQKTKYPEPPTYPGALPLVGHLLLLAGNVERIWTTLRNISDYTMKEGGVVKFYLGPKLFYLISEPEDVAKVANKCLHKSFLYDFGKQFAGNGLLLSEFTLWQKNRKLFAPFFNQRAVNTFLHIFNRQSKQLVEKLAVHVGKGKFDPLDLTVNIVLDTVDQTILGLEEDESCAQINSSYIHTIDDIFDLFAERLQKIWLVIPYLYNRSNLKKRLDDLIDDVKTKTAAVIKKRQPELRNDKKLNQDPNDVCGKGKSLLDFILEDVAKSENFTDDEIREHITTFIVAAFDTTGRTVVFALNLIGAHPHVQERIFKELEEVFGDTNRDVEKEDITKLIYLEAVIKEAIRILPVIPFFSRTNEYDLKLKNYTIPSGATMICSIYAVNRHPSWGDDVFEFKPERWLEDKPPPALFAGFSFGKRNCIGGLYAMAAIKTNMVHLFRRYRVSSDNTDIVMKFHALLKPISGHDISVELRS